ncbi:MAG TPA: o-succinylbenzoate synthase [Bryobacteraceae bacterium]|jgi:O-succinylbenzoate synthase|nr:o-succinylbenzoate synthase [Bryobacteraceae bacterium]
MDRSITLDWVQVPLKEPFRISNGAVAVKDAIVVSYRQDGVTGYGEASPMSGAFYSTETPESSWAALEKLAPAALRNPDVDLDTVVEGEAFAKAGLAGALVDRNLRAIKKPLWEWLGAADRPVPSGVAIGIFDTVEELLDRVQLYVSQGYRRVKIKIQHGWDVEPVCRVREKFPNVPLMVDANAAYTIADLPVFRELDRFGLMMYEQPLGRHALEEMAELSRSVKTPVCADESAESLAMLERLIELGSAKIINIKIQRVGGIHSAKRMHDRAQEAGLPCWMGTMPELGIASVEAVHLATLPNFQYPTDVEASSRWYTDDIIEPQIQISAEGYLQAQVAQVSQEKLERYCIKHATLK